MIPHVGLLLWAGDDGGFMSPVAAVTPSYGYFPPAVVVYAENRIFIQSDVRVTVEQSNIVTLRK